LGGGGICCVKSVGRVVQVHATLEAERGPDRYKVFYLVDQRYEIIAAKKGFYRGSKPIHYGVKRQNEKKKHYKTNKTKQTDKN